jgi:hypothetical protein
MVLRLFTNTERSRLGGPITTLSVISRPVEFEETFTRHRASAISLKRVRHLRCVSADIHN